MRKIEQYRVYYFGGGSGSDTDGRAGIRLIGEDDTTIAWLKFWKDSSAMPASDEELADGVVRAHYPQGQLRNVLDLLRNESPLFLDYGEFERDVAVISTHKEPVGEAERRLTI